MKITDISTTIIEYPLTRPIGDVNIPDGVNRAREMVLTVETDQNGLTGVSIGPAWGAKAVDSYLDLLIGKDPRSVRALWDEMIRGAFKLGVARGTKGAIGTIDCALWDIRAKAHDVPLWKELGAGTNKVPGYASGLDMPLTDDELIDFYERMADRGFSAGKLKVGRDPERDRHRVGLMRDALAKSGKPPSVMIDANEFWSPKQAIQRIRSLEQVASLTWVEEPVRRTDYGGLRRVSECIDAPVATGENLNQAQDFRPLFEYEAVDVVQIGAMLTGITGALRVAEFAASFDRPVAMSNAVGRQMAHLAAALPNHVMMEVKDIGRDRVLAESPIIKDGHIILNDQPGAGIKLDEDVLDEKEVDSRPTETVAGSYTRSMDAGLVGEPTAYRTDHIRGVEEDGSI